MRKKETAPKADVGVIVGRFQVPTLHDAHLELIESVCKEHSKVLVFLGLSPCLVTRNNPLDFHARQQMLLQSFPSLIVSYIKDMRSDEIWSKKLDEKIDDLIGPNQTVMLYGSRDCFIRYYSGKYSVTELESSTYISGTEIRKGISNRVKESPDFRAGVIWAAYNQHPKVFSTVDVAIFNEDKTKILLARKPYEDRYRFVGGFCMPNSEDNESDARREVQEEASIAITDPEYIGSKRIADWRYRNEVDKIRTNFYAAKIFSGRPAGADDVAEVRWFEVSDLQKNYKNLVMEEHIPLVEMLFEKFEKIKNRL